ncbi:nucleotidyltransferase family protein [Nocardia rhizosphaerae]|uniref:Nucleotidyltransferase family protein n=1 Tax=Nocardia rhizosphaerae TaxID=1691571 RepID=A0ABV8LBP2_9NOCA
MRETVGEVPTAKDIPIDDIAGTFAAGRPDAKPFLRARVARGENGGLPTLVSAWLAGGNRVSEPYATELQLHRERVDRYQAVLDELRDVEPRTVCLKGLSAALWYPDELVRDMADLDLVLPDVSAIWRCGRRLAESGWVPGGIRVWHVGGRMELTLVMRRPAVHPDLTYPDEVDLSTISYEGDRVTMPPRHRVWPADPTLTLADCVMCLLEELRDRRIRMRDVFDLAVFVGRIRPVDTREIVDLVVEYRALAPLRSLIAAASIHLPSAVPWLSEVYALARQRSRLPHMPWWVTRAPVTSILAVAAEVSRRRSGIHAELAERLLIGAQRGFGADRLIAMGAALVGMPVSESGSRGGQLYRHGRQLLDEAELVTDGARAHLSTPVGQFVLTLGGSVCEEWLDEFPLRAE